LPPYLSAESKGELLAQLRAHPDSVDYYGSVANEREPLQGDIWRGFLVADVESGKLDQVTGLVLTNSCDIAAANNPGADQRIVFAPLLDLEKYGTLLRESGKSEQQVEGVIAAIRRQEIHRMFYLPAMRDLQRESVVPLDAVSSLPLSFIQGRVRHRLTLSNFGWYILLVKLSIHFCRMQEQVSRVTVK
jgi:hypothetical protein